MSISKDDFLKRLRKLITSFYTESDFSGTDLHLILDTYATNLSSGSVDISQTQDDLFILRASENKLYDNLGTFVNAPRYFYQDSDEDIYVTNDGSGTFPSYRKEIDFLFDSSIHGSTLHASQRVGQSFSLVNPDIREFYKIPRWKLQYFSGSAPNTNSLNSNTLEIWANGALYLLDPGWFRNQWRGSMATIVNKSTSVTEKYVVDSNTQNSITVEPIYND
jgi:hypothetical protein